MSAQYKKAEDLDDKIKKLQLPYFQWKVLFVVSEGVTVDEMSTTLDEKKENIEAALEALSSHGLIESVVSSEEPQEEELFDEEKLADVEKDKATEDISEVEPAPSQKEEDESEIEIPEMELESDDDSEEETLEKLAEDDFVSSLEEKEDQIQEETPEELEEKAEKSEVGEFLEGINTPQDEAEADAPETAVAEEQDIEEPAQDETISDVSKKTIMVIDDSIVIRKMIEIALEEEDLRIVTATSGAEGIEALENNEPNLIILDMLLPDMNGIDLLKKIKEAKNIPVIMLSGKDSPQLVENAKELGVDDFLPKPFRDEELVEKVKNLLS